MVLDKEDDKFLTPAVADQVNVGGPEILQSVHVSEGPGRIANSPVPSVYSDDRGEIHRLRVGGMRVNLLFSKAGVMRSGYLHHNNTHDFIISGKVEVWSLTEDSTKKQVYEAQQYFSTPSYVPHILHFLEDSIILEFWEPGEFRCWYYHPYRNVVQVQNSLVSPGATGTFHRLITEDVETPLYHKDKKSKSSTTSSSSPSWLWCTTGLIVGFALGTILSKQQRR